MLKKFPFPLRNPALRLYSTKPMVRPDITIPKAPQAPFPLTEHHVKVVAGFGRGSSELGIPTANVSTHEVQSVLQLDPGVYFGYSRVTKDEEHKISEIKQRENGTDVDYKYGHGLIEGKDLNVVLPHVMSIGWNPFYGNKEKAVELHIIHEFSSTFYGAIVDFNVLGYIRPELNYTTKEALIKDIQTDIDIGLKTLETPEYQKYKDF